MLCRLQQPPPLAGSPGRPSAWLPALPLVLEPWGLSASRDAASGKEQAPGPLPGGHGAGHLRNRQALWKCSGSWWPALSVRLSDVIHFGGDPLCSEELTRAWPSQPARRVLPSDEGGP